MFDSYSDDVMSIEEPLELAPNYLDSPQRLEDDEAQDCSYNEENQTDQIINKG